MLGSMRNRDCISYPGVGTFVLIRPAQTFYERINLAEGLARSGIVVMIPWLETQNRNRIAIEDIDSLVRAFQRLRALDSVDPERVGMGGICTGTSMVTVAAQDERIRDHVKFINFFAGYYDAVDLVKAIGSRSRFYDGELRTWRPGQTDHEGVHQSFDRGCHRSRR